MSMPLYAHAFVQITEIMYDLSGPDSGREWIEITNTGAEPVDVSKYKITEGSTNHGLIIFSGNNVLPPGGSAIVADDPIKFKEDWPAFSGTLFNSTFSLSNTGETLVIKNASSTVEDTALYASSGGAAGDGGSLHRSAEIFIAALPNPGVFPGSIVSVPKVEKPAPVAKSSVTSAKSKTAKTKSSTQAAAALEAPHATFDPNAEVNTNNPTPLLIWALGLAAIIALGVAGALYAHLQSSKARRLLPVTSNTTDEFEIVEE
ncbi:MAG: S-layer-like protein array protein [Parcubacteria group bacterium Gr01-1014_56]|nr:MAG: S-layer-like protein array protein [Parcubacteria group bacterium Gr01-1014_56]